MEAKELTPLEKRIERLKAESKAKLDQDIEKVTKEENAKEARKTLEKKIKDEKASLEVQHNKYIKDFEKEYGVTYQLGGTITENSGQKKLELLEKCKLVDKEMKYKLSEDGTGIIGVNGEKITSIIKFNDAEGKKQTLGVHNYYKHLKPETSKEDLNRLFPNTSRKK